jgi:ribosomal-protein-alanine N-acetyltransferase
LFDTKPINKLTLNINPNNASSKSVAQKCRFTSEGIDRGAVFSHGEYVDIERFGILRNEFYRK